MRITVLTMFPELFGDFRKSPVLARELDRGRVELKIVDIKEYAPGSFRRIDDSPYGGGAGMILRCQPVLDALKAVRRPESYVVIPAPVGKVFRQADAHRFSAMEDLILICGHYEGLDARIYEHADELISVGDYILTGGELPAMVLIDAAVRLREGALRGESTRDESFENGLLEYPQYTRPADYQGQRVPEILLSGNHEEIRKWRLAESLRLTRKLRPDLLKDRPDLSEE